jgi:hypothetical protein
LSEEKGEAMSPEQAKPRRILGYPNAPYLDNLKNQISSQSRVTVLKWAIDYVEANQLVVFESRFPDDFRPRAALASARNFISDENDRADIKIEMQPLVLACHAAARAAESDAAAQAAARTCAQAASSVYELGHTLGIAYFGSAAAAYARVGINQDAATYDRLAADECERQYLALKAISIDNEPDPTEIVWHM